MTRLAEVAQLERTTLGRNLRPLEQGGLIASSASDTDARERIISLTSAGIQAIEEAMPLWRKAQAKVEKGLGSERLAMLRDLLDELAQLAP